MTIRLTCTMRKVTKATIESTVDGLLALLAFRRTVLCTLWVLSRPLAVVLALSTISVGLGWERSISARAGDGG